MNFPNDQFELILAEDGDWREIKEIFESGEFDGGIAVQYLRNPNPIASFEKEGEKVVILMLRDKQKNKAVGFGACIIKRVYKDKKVVNMGYLTGLKLLPQYRKRIFVIPDCYQKIYEYTGDQVDFYFTTILKENTAVRKMLEKPRKLMPLYDYLGDYRVYFCKSGISNLNFGRQDNTKAGAEYFPRRCGRNELVTFFSKQAQGADLSLESIAAYDLENAVYYGLYKDNVLTACGYVLNQQQYKQYVVKKYAGIYRLISKLPTRLLGYPSFPGINETANCACAGLWAENNDVVSADKLWRFMRRDAKEFDFLMIGFFENHPLRSYFEKTKHIHYDSCCYIVDFKHNKNIFDELSEENLYIDVAFL
ncbi:MAG: hypothetical protein GXY86_16555 [Firmicutes bacterium]|nr:hypothetical protein [Bacillota bacterium]